MTTQIQGAGSDGVDLGSTDDLNGAPSPTPCAENDPYQWPDEALERLWLALRRGDQ